MFGTGHKGLLRAVAGELSNFFPPSSPPLTDIHVKPASFHPPNLYCPSLPYEYCQSCGLCTSSTPPSFFFYLFPHKVMQYFPTLHSVLLFSVPLWFCLIASFLLVIFSLWYFSIHDEESAEHGACPILLTSSICTCPATSYPLSKNKKGFLILPVLC